MCVREKKSVCVGESGCVWERVSERDSVVCVCVCLRRAQVCVCVSERVCERE